MSPRHDPVPEGGVDIRRSTRDPDVLEGARTVPFDGQADGGRQQSPASAAGTRGAEAAFPSIRRPRGFRRPDSRIQEDICDLLAEHPQIDASSIEVFVKDGEVTLSGCVVASVQRRVAEAVAVEVVGVCEVRNVLAVAGSQQSER